jgi:hypothetical protein
MYPQLFIFSRRFKALLYFIFNTAQFIAALIGIFSTTLGLAVIAWFFKLQFLLIPAICFSLGIFVALVIVILTYARSTPSRRFLRGYRWVKAEYKYTIHDDDPKHHSQTITILLEALRHGVGQFENRYLWSGKGKENDPKVISPGHSLIGPPVQRGLWKFYFVYLGRELSVGERAEVIITQDLYDTENKFEPFLAKTVFEPLDRLILRAVFPRNALPSQASCCEEGGPVPTNNLIRSIQAEINPTGEILWAIESPVFGHRYEIRWSK